MSRPALDSARDARSVRAHRKDARPRNAARALSLLTRARERERQTDTDTQIHRYTDRQTDRQTAKARRRTPWPACVAAAKACVAARLPSSSNGARRPARERNQLNCQKNVHNPQHGIVYKRSVTGPAWGARVRPRCKIICKILILRYKIIYVIWIKY